MKILIGGIYKQKSGELTRIIGDNSQYYKGRGCNRQNATPNNFIKPEELSNPTLLEILNFLHEEMANGMAQRENRK
jgi:hypothetical protein